MLEMDVTVALEILNVVLLVGLLYVFMQNYRSMKTHFGLGLILFAGILLLQNLAALGFHWFMVAYYTKEVAFHALALKALESAALIVLSWITWKA
ncbi:MAG: hypothetical protein HY393_03485 [Candidatus Diapherotrites archaeon]|nr:hypothetical protein [Candidatus Diapherotrites archaeon]